MLHNLLYRARSDDGATVLIPDLQRPYVWSPTQVALLIDSLICGWPFSMLLMWKIGQGEIQDISYRPFWRVVDGTQDGNGTMVTRKDPPAGYHTLTPETASVELLGAWRAKTSRWIEGIIDISPLGRKLPGKLFD